MAKMPRNQLDAATRARTLMQENMKRLNGGDEGSPSLQIAEPPPAPEIRLSRAGQQVVVEVTKPEEAPQGVLETPQEETVEDWHAKYEEAEQRWRSADGMMKQQGAEFRRTKAEMEAARKAAEAEAAKVREELEALRSQLEQNRPASTEDLKRYFTPEQLERLGEDEAREFLRAQRAMAQDVHAVTRKEVQAELRAARESMEAEKASLQELKQQQFTGSLDAKMPEWRNIDNQPEFHAFLMNIDPLSGLSYKELGENAAAARDPNRFLAVYKTFQSTQAKTTTVASPKRVLPNGVPPASGTPTGSSQKAPPVSMNEIKEYQRKSASGYYRRHPEEMQRDRARVLSALPQKQPA